MVNMVNSVLNKECPFCPFNAATDVDLNMHLREEHMKLLFHCAHCLRGHLDISGNMYDGQYQPSIIFLTLSGNLLPQAKQYKGQLV